MASGLHFSANASRLSVYNLSFLRFSAPNWKSFSVWAQINALLTKSISKPTSHQKKASRMQNVNMVLNALVRKLAVKCSHVHCTKKTILIITLKIPFLFHYYSSQYVRTSLCVHFHSDGLHHFRLSIQFRKKTCNARKNYHMLERPQTSLFWWWACSIWWWCRGMQAEWVDRFRLWLNPLRIQIRIQRLWSRSRLWLNPGALYRPRTLQAYLLRWYLL